MSRSKKWKLEWSFFLGSDGRRKYNDLCRRCVHPCKQSFRAVNHRLSALLFQALGTNQNLSD